MLLAMQVFGLESSVSSISLLFQRQNKSKDGMLKFKEFKQMLEPLEKKKFSSGNSELTGNAGAELFALCELLLSTETESARLRELCPI